MKKLLGMLALGIVLSLSTGGAKDVTRTDDDCKVVSDVSIQAEFDHDNVGDSELKGKLFNTSNVEYEDIMIQVDFYNSDQQKLGSQSLKFTEDLRPGETEDFKFEFDTPEGTNHASYTIACAEEE